MLQIVTAPNAVLSEKAAPVGKIDKEIHLLIEQMIETLNNAKDPEGVGLAAPQVGKSLQIFIAKPSGKSPILVCINPKIISIDSTIEPSPEMQGQFFDSESMLLAAQTRKGEGKRGKVKLEGCLSLIDVWGQVRRNPKVKISYLDENGKKRTRLFTGFLATIIQHEYDHLQGVLFPKHVLEQKGKLYKSSKNEKGETEFEEISI